MHDMSDYIRMVARSMGRNIKDDDAKILAYELIKSQKYNDLLNALELKIKNVTENYSKNENIYDSYINKFNSDTNDELLPQVLQFTIENGEISVSMIQRRYKIGYHRSARLIDLLEEIGVISEYQGLKPRIALVSSESIEANH